MAKNGVRYKPGVDERYVVRTVFEAKPWQTGKPTKFWSVFDNEKWTYVTAPRTYREACEEKKGLASGGLTREKAQRSAAALRWMTPGIQ